MRYAITFLLVLVTLLARAQSDTTGQAAKLEEQRAQSGVDPTRVMSRVSYSPYVLDPSGDAVSFNNRFRYVLGLGSWSMGLRQEFSSVHSGEPGTGFTTGRGDLRLSVLNAFHVKGRTAFAASADLDMPTGSAGFTTNAAVLTLGLTYSYTIKPTLIFACQPQYTFAPVKDAAVPDISTVTLRSFLAHFRTSGWFYVFEPRPVFDLANDNFDLVLSPIAGKNLAKGFSVVALAEFHIDADVRASRGDQYQLGISKNF
ncbi:MAG: hypothetical protein JNL05_10635 [Flavobacteriales bacterium]|nr:hypothetical protein [Flavobacteriales bacterium]